MSLLLDLLPLFQPTGPVVPAPEMTPPFTVVLVNGATRAEVEMMTLAVVANNGATRAEVPSG